MGDTAPTLRPRIVFIVKSTASYFWQVVYVGAKTAAAEYGVDVEMFAPETEDDYLTQIHLIEQAVENQYDGIVFSSVDYDKTVPAIEAAMDTGMQVVTIDSGIGTTRNVMFIGTDNYTAGRQAGEALDELTGGAARIGVISFEEFSANGMERTQGFFDYIESKPDMLIEDLRYCISNREEPKAHTLDMLKENPGIDAIATFNEWTTLGVGDAIDESGRGEDIVVIAFDNNVESVAMLEKGVINALIVQNPFAMGYLGVEQLLSQINGNKLGETTIYTESVVITKENMFTPQNQKLLFPFAHNE